MILVEVIILMLSSFLSLGRVRDEQQLLCVIASMKGEIPYEGNPF